MNYIVLLLAVIAAIHAYSYGIWLRENKQLPAFIAIALCAIISLFLPLYHLYLKSK